MIVYVAIESDFDFHKILGVYKNKKDAELITRLGKEQYPGLFWDVEEHDLV